MEGGGVRGGIGRWDKGKPKRRRIPRPWLLEWRHVLRGDRSKNHGWMPWRSYRTEAQREAALRRYRSEFSKPPITVEIRRAPK